MEVSLRTLLLFCCLPTVLAHWWYLGITPAYLNPRERRAKDPKHRCNIPVFKARQRELCIEDDKIVPVIARGARMAIEECQNQFNKNRWNCSTFNTTDVFGGVVKHKSRETAYIYAIQSAGAMFAVTRACSRGELTSCGCDDRIRYQSTGGRFSWGGCSDDVTFGKEFAKDFVDNTELKVKGHGLMNLWNNEAGRETVKETTKLHCKCHGITGDCAIKTCWRTMDVFTRIGKALKDRFDGATQVKYVKRKRKLRPKNKHLKPPSKTDLVYINMSPDFCKHNLKEGSLGTKGRLCNRTSDGTDGCQLMCCGRGYYTNIKEVVEECNCKFIWCCRVECEKCVYQREFNYCN